MAGPTGTLQTANPALGTVSREPQTTGPGADTSTPFVRLSRKSQILAYQTSGVTFGSPITQSLKAVGGYIRYLYLTIQATGGTSTGAVVANADAPWNVIQSIFLRDPQGQPIYQTNGYDLFLSNLFSGCVADSGFQSPAVQPSFSAIQLTTGAGAGNFTFKLKIPMELDSAGWCCLPSMNASSQPTLQINLNPASSVYSTAPTTLPTLTVTVEEAFWATPIAAPNLAPPQIGSSYQISEGTVPQQVNGQFSRLTWPRVGTYITTMIGVLRDNTGARVAAYPASDLALFIDGVPVLMETYADRVDKIYQHFGITLPTGVVVYTFRDSVQQSVNQADTHDMLLPTTPATLLEVAGTWGSVTNAPGTLTAVTHEVYPVGGIPYTHLAM